MPADVQSKFVRMGVKRYFCVDKTLPMKIGFDAKRLFNNTSGLGNYSRTLVRQLVSGYPQDKFTLFTPKARLEVDFLPAPNAETVFPEGIWKRFKGLWRTAKTAALSQDMGLDIYHGLSHELPSGIQKSGVKSVVTVHDLIFMRHPEFYSPVDVWIHKRKVRYACRVADAVIAISEQTKKDIVELLGTPENKIHVIYQSIEPWFAREIPQADMDRELAGLGLPEKFVLCVGTIEKRKNQLALLQAMKDLPDVHLVLVGRRSGSYGKNLEKYIEKHGLSNRVTFLSGVTSRRLACLYRKCLFVAYPSVYEGFGLPIVEGIGSGKAILTTSGGCFSEAGGPGALYVPVGDIRAMTEALGRLWNDAQLRETLAGQGREYIMRFSDTGTSRKVYEVYRNILGVGR